MHSKLFLSVESLTKKESQSDERAQVGLELRPIAWQTCSKLSRVVGRAQRNKFVEEQVFEKWHLFRRRRRQRNGSKCFDDNERVDHIRPATRRREF